MKNEILASLARLSDAALVLQVKTLVRRERDVTAEVVAHLAELDTRDVHLREGYTSLFLYCREVLGLSEWEAYNRIEVARTVRRFPVILGMLAEGAVHLTAIRRLAPHLTVANHEDVLQSARGKTKVEIEEIVARLCPRPDVAASVRRLPQAMGALLDVPPVATGMEPFAEGAGPEGPGYDAPASVDLRSSEPLPGAGEQPQVAAAFSRPGSAPAVTPLAPDRYKLQLTISGNTLEKLRLAQDMLGHAIPSGDQAEVLDRALTVLVAELAKTKFADTARPRPADTSNGPHEEAAMGKRAARHVPAAVKRAVWVRDLGRCAFVGSGGHRCNERRCVEFHHVDPYALGGEASVEGIQLRCRSHNDYEGRLYFGERRPARGLVPEQVSTARRATSREGGRASNEAVRRMRQSITR
jgi:hypothetical protein